MILILLVALSWISETPLPTPRAAHGLVVLNDCIYVIGGLKGYYECGGWVTYGKLASDGRILYWDSTTSLPDARGDFVCVTYDNVIYVIGGQGPAGFFKNGFYAFVNQDNTITEWKTLSDIPEPRDDATGVVYDGYIYVIGGRDWFDRKNTVYYGKIEEDYSVRNWYQTTSLPCDLSYCRAVLYHNHIYVVGGRGDDPIPSNKVFVAEIKPDHTLGEWREVTSLPIPLVAPAVVVHGNEIYVMGGWTEGKEPTNQVFVAEIKEDYSLGEWEFLDTLPRSYSWLKAVVWNDWLYLVGGYDGEELSDVYRAKLKRYIEACFELHPRVINKKSHGRYLTGYIELPQNYDPSDIIISSVRLIVNNDSIFAYSHPTHIGDHDNDGILDLMVKFSRRKFIEIAPLGFVEVKVRGSLVTGEEFEGRDTVKVINGCLWKVLPNPFYLTMMIVPGDEANETIRQKSILSVGTNERQFYNVKIYDITGRVIKAFEVQNFPLIWDGKDDGGREVPAGIYVIEIEKEGEFSRLKVLKFDASR